MLDMDLAASVRAVETAMRAGNRTLAMQFAGQAVRLGEGRPQFLVLAAYDALERGAAGEALGYAERARSANRRDGETLNAYALSLGANGRHAEALSAFDEALRQAPGQPRFYYGKGCIYEEIGDNVSARLCFERAVAAAPDDVRALSRLAFLAVERGDFAAARAYGERTGRLMPGEPCAALAMASADVHEKNYQAALTRLKPFAAQKPNINRAIAESLSGDALDGLGRRREAFAAYSASNTTMQTLYATIYDVPGEPTARATVEHLIAYFGDASAADWACRKTGEAARTHVFLVGFPRSGTTLLEQALAAHPAIDCMEEVPCLAEAEDEFLGNPAALLAEKDLEPWRKAYWRAARDSGQTLKRKVFIDKLPLNAVILFLVAKLFPDAKIVFALRDPVDVVWSGFRRRFAMSAQMVELTCLERAARYYDSVMTLAMLYRDKLGLDWYDVAYEKLVADFDGETRRLCAFLGVEWRAEMADFAATSRKRAPNTPSSAQVARGLYTTAVGQWTRYREDLQSVLPILAPWRARFGYQEQSDAPRS